MTSPGLFLAGAAVTLIVAAALALLVYMAVLDGRYHTEKRAEEEDLRAETGHETAMAA